MMLPDPKADGKRFRRRGQFWAVKMDNAFTVESRTQTMKGEPGDYLVENERGDLFVAKAGAFEEAYEELNESKVPG